MRVVCALLAAMLTAGACTEEPTEGPDAGSGHPIRFDVSQSDAAPWIGASRAADDDAAASESDAIPLKSEDSDLTLYLHATVSDTRDDASGSGPATRGTPVTNLEKPGSKIGVISFVYNADQEWSEKFTPSLMVNIPVEYEADSGKGWITKESYYWPGSRKKIRFFAYAPYDEWRDQVSDLTLPGIPAISYTVPEHVSDQHDFLVADSGELPGDGSEPAALKFRHALTAIRFAAGKIQEPGYISSISLKKVNGKGVCSLGDATWTEWSEPNSSYTLTFDPPISIGSTIAPDDPITNEDQTFFVIPQQLPDEATVEMMFTERGATKPQTFTASIAGRQWSPGKIIIYRISTQ